MSVQFVKSAGADDDQKVVKLGPFHKVVAVTDNVVVTMEGDAITGGNDITFTKMLEIEETMEKVTVSNGTVAIYTY